MHTVWTKEGDGPWKFDGFWFMFRNKPYRIRNWRLYHWT